VAGARVSQCAPLAKNLFWHRRASTGTDEETSGEQLAVRQGPARPDEMASGNLLTSAVNRNVPGDKPLRRIRVPDVGRCQHFSRVSAVSGRWRDTGNAVQTITCAESRDCIAWSFAAICPPNVSRCRQISADVARCRQMSADVGVVRGLASEWEKRERSPNEYSEGELCRHRAFICCLPSVVVALQRGKVRVRSNLEPQHEDIPLARGSNARPAEPALAGLIGGPAFAFGHFFSRFQTARVMPESGSEASFVGRGLPG
jgi:hypothetical protein